LNLLNWHVLSIHLLPVHRPCAIGKLIEDESVANVTEKWIEYPLFVSNWLYGVPIKSHIILGLGLSTFEE